MKLLKYLFLLTLSLFCCAAGVIAQVQCSSESPPIGGLGSTFAACPSSIEPAMLAEVQVRGPMWPSLPSANTEFAEMGPGVRVFKTSQTGLFLRALAGLDQYFAVTLTLPGGGSGFLVPCLSVWSTTYGSSAAFAGVNLTITQGDENNCTGGTAGPADMVPFESGVLQIFHGVFSTATTGMPGHPESGAAFLQGILLFDQQGMPLSPANVRLSFQDVPEPAGLLLIPAGVVCLLFRRPARSKRRRYRFWGARSFECNKPSARSYTRSAW